VAKDVQGEVVAEAPVGAAGTERLRELYRGMVRVRALNDEAVRLHRQGVLLGFAPCTGQEAAQVGSAAAMDGSRDFAFQTYREFGVAVMLGVDPAGLLAHFRGFADGGDYDIRATRLAPLNSVVGGTALHAAGWAMGAKLDGTGGCAIAYFGEGASSQGEVHEAMNFAGVFGLPVVFFCQNNQWAISVPASAQIAGGSVAARAEGYGLPGVQIDGNNVLEVYEATSAALARAREGGGAYVIEAITYRLGPHATSDDPSRYRTEAEEASWRQRDPLLLARRLLEREDGAEHFLAEVDADAAAELDRFRERVLALEPPSFDEQLGFVYERPPESALALARRWLEQNRLD
jgi:2-oxoisovalerate dehydrogenase E1 component alpha subunit